MGQKEHFRDALRSLRLSDYSLEDDDPAVKQLIKLGIVHWIPQLV